MLPTWADTLLVLLAIVLAGWALYERNKNGKLTDITLPQVVGTIESSVPLATELRDVAQMVVFETEQFRRDPSHNITDDEAFRQAYAKVQSWFPAQTEGLTPEKINTAIHAAILLASQASNAIEAAKDAKLGSLLSASPKN